MKRPATFALAIFAVAMIVFAQQPPPAPAAGAATSTQAGTATTSTASEGSELPENLQEILEESDAASAYRYDPQGRRDPFRSLVGPSPKVSRENAPPGPPGFLIDEMDLQGVVRTRQGLVAMVNGPDNNGYLLKQGDKVFDGEVIRITSSSVVFRQEVNDPTRIERFREVVKEIEQSGAKR
jgi:type IV pilus assembly protein PilP